MWCGSFFEELCGCLAKARSEIAGLQVVGDDGGAIGLTFACEYGWPSGTFRPLVRTATGGMCSAPSIRKRIDDVAWTFSDVKCNLDVATVVDDGRGDLDTL